MIQEIDALFAFQSEGTFQGAAQKLGKSHTSILYLIHSLEKQLGVALLEKRRQKTYLTGAALALLPSFSDFKRSERSLLDAASALASGRLRSLTLIYDGVFSSGRLLSGLAKFRRRNPETEVNALSGYLSEVEGEFERKQADALISVVPLSNSNLKQIRIGEVKMVQVCSTKFSDVSLLPLVTLRGSDERLALPKNSFNTKLQMQVGDFPTKREAILLGLGFGWLPLDLIAKDLREGRLKAVGSEKASQFSLPLRMAWRATPVQPRWLEELKDAFGVSSAGK